MGPVSEDIVRHLGEMPEIYSKELPFEELLAMLEKIAYYCTGRV